MTYKQWHSLLVANFEKQYYVPKGKCQAILADVSHVQADAQQDKDYAVDSNLIARRGVYKDVVGSGSSHPWADYQLRCNFPVAMTVAPELFNPQHAIEALQMFYDVMWNGLGVLTLDPNDRNYRPYYDNSNDSDDPAVAKGRK